MPDLSQGIASGYNPPRPRPSAPETEYTFRIDECEGERMDDVTCQLLDILGWIIFDRYIQPPLAGLDLYMEGGKIMRFLVMGLPSSPISSTPVAVGIEWSELRDLLVIGPVGNVILCVGVLQHLGGFFHGAIAPHV